MLKLFKLTAGSRPVAVRSVSPEHDVRFGVVGVEVIIEVTIDASVGSGDTW